MSGFGHTIRVLREKQGLTLRTVADALGIDQAILSKIERGFRKPAREMVVKIAAYFQYSENDLMVQYLADKIVYEIEDESTALEALQLAEEQMLYKTSKPASRTPAQENKAIKKQLAQYFKTETRVKKAWLFGSFARGENTPESDVDVMIEMNEDKTYTLFDLLDIQFRLEKLLQRKVDVVEKDYIKPHAKAQVAKDLTEIV